MQAIGDPRADQHAAHGGDADKQRPGHVDVAAEPKVDRAERRDDRDRSQRGRRRMMLLPVEPQNQQRNEDDAAADSEQTTQKAGSSADNRQLNRSRPRHPGHTRPVSDDLTERVIDRLIADPERTALMLDVDGTLAPIVDRPADATVPVPVRMTLIELGRRCGLVACISGRQADEARRIVGAGGITYVGGHGSEVLRPGSSEPTVDSALEPWVSS